MTTKGEVAAVLRRCTTPASRGELVLQGGPVLVETLRRLGLLTVSGRVWELPCAQRGEPDCLREVRERDGTYFAVCGRIGDPCTHDGKLDADDLVEFAWEPGRWAAWLRAQCRLDYRATGPLLPAGGHLIGERVDDEGRLSVYWLPDPAAHGAPRLLSLVSQRAGEGRCALLVPDIGGIPLDQQDGLRAAGLHVVGVADHMSLGGGALTFTPPWPIAGHRPTRRRATESGTATYTVATDGAQSTMSAPAIVELRRDPERWDLYVDFTGTEVEGRIKAWTRLRRDAAPDWVQLNAAEAFALRTVIQANGNLTGGTQLSKPGAVVGKAHKALERARAALFGRWKRGRKDWLPTAGTLQYQWRPPAGSCYAVVLTKDG